MKVTLRETYSWKAVVLEATEHPYSKEFQTDLEYQDVMEMLKIQVQMEALQQRLRPLFEAMKEAKKANDEAKQREEEAQKVADHDEFPNAEDLARLERPSV